MCGIVRRRTLISMGQRGIDHVKEMLYSVGYYRVKKKADDRI